MNRQIDSLSPEPSSGKFKGSCDNCSAAKVRCTKEKPSCARCLKSGSTCLYSPARRFGRPHQRPPPSRQSPLRLADHHKDMEIGLEPARRRSFAQPTTRTVATVPTTVTRQPAQADTEAHHAHDCFQLITGLLQDLDGPAAGLPHVDAMLSRLALTLICNCSQQQDLSLLVVMGCHAVLDRVGGVLGRCDKLAQETYLRKVAGLVAQLTRRYCGTGAPEELARTIPGLALELKLRLQETVAQSHQGVGDMGLGLVGGGAFTYEELDLGECLL